MLPRETIATAQIPDGKELTLVSHGRDFIIMLGRDELMGTRMQFSEEQLAVLTLAELDAPRPRVLIGGFGMGFTYRAALAHLPEGGVIINTGSITGLEGSKGLLDYSATKGATHAFTKTLAQELVERKIRVNCVAPGPVWTPLNPAERPHSGEHGYEDFGADTPYGRPAQPEEVAPAYVFFASNADSGYITGEVLTLLGGDTRAG